MPRICSRVRVRTASLAVCLTLAALVAAVAATPSGAAAGPAAATVRVEGLNSTLYPLTAVTTTATPATGDGGAHTCPSGYNAANALSIATAGNWAGSYSTSYNDWLVSRIGSETYPASSGPNAAYNGFYWAFWDDHAPATAGVCGTAVNNGDEILFFPDCFSSVTYGSTCPPGWVSPNVLGLAAPTVAQRGQPVQVTVTSYANSNGAPSPASGATVSGSGSGATTDSAGNASVTFAATGTFTLQATASNSVRSETRAVCVHDGNDGNCGFPGPSAPASPVAAPNQPVTLLGGAITGIAEQQHFRRGPHQLSGTASPDASGLQKVELRLERRVGRACSGYDGVTERFARIRCGIANAGWFRVTSQRAFSYLLPWALPRGRYVVELVATDGAGRADRIDLGRNEIIFYVG